MHRLIPLALALLLAACSGGVYRDRDVPISSIAAFEPARYAGLWYEIARFPVPFQTGCTDVTAEYTARADGTFGVLNRCLKDGALEQISGDARLEGPGRLSVRLNGVPLVRAPYWVLWVDDDYETAVVGVPSGRAGWILARTPDIREDRLRSALQVLEFNGYDTSQIQRTPQGQ